MEQPRWATFDCYGTLIDWNGGVTATLRDVFGREDVGDLLDRYHEIEREIESGPYRTYREVLDMILARLAEEQGRPLTGGERTAMSDSLARWPAFPEVPDALREAQSRGWKLAILSNCDRDLIATSLPKLGVDFDEVIVAEDVQSYKPAHEHWMRFAQLTGADGDRHAHVAASLFHDIEPTHELGLRNVWVNRLGEQATAPPDREITNLTPLPDVLDDLVKP
jgi:2-haloacid dehalogenase